MEKVYEAVLEGLRSGKPLALVTLIETKGSTPREPGAKMVVHANGSTVGTIGGGAMEAQALSDALDVLAEGRSRTTHYSLMGKETDLGICGGEARAFIEAIIPKPRLIVAGAGHVGQALAALGAISGYSVVVVDDREEYATAERIPSAARVVVAPFDRLASAVDITAGDSIVIATRGHEHDAAVLRQVVESGAAYVGLIGSRRKIRSILEQLAAEGVPRTSLARVMAPIGLDIGGSRPDEIALSIMAEVVMMRYGATGESLSARWNPMRAEMSGSGDETHEPR